MDPLEAFDRHREVIEDFTRNSLAAIPHDFARLLYIASLLDLASGRYQHDGLSALYPDESVQYALAHCHRQVFARCLEIPLEQQEADLRETLGSLAGHFWEIVRRWQETELFRMLVPVGTPDYLRDLFSSNARTLLALIAEERSNSPAAS